MAKKPGITVYLHLQEPKLSDKVYDAARREIALLDCLSELGPATTKDVAQRVGLSPNAVASCFSRLKETFVKYTNQKWELLP